MSRYGVSPDLIAVAGDGAQILADGCAFQPVRVTNPGFDLDAFVDEMNAQEEGPTPLPPRQKANSAEPFNPNLAEILLRAGIVQDSQAAVAAPIIAPANIPKRTPEDKNTNFSLYLLVTQYCNLKCVYCYNGDETYERERHLKMPFETAQNAVRFFLDRLAEGGVLSIVFFGGEPLLNWPVIKQTIDWLEANPELKQGKRVNYHITTNLTVMPDELIDYAKRYGITFLVDIDGREEHHNRLRPARAASLNSFARTCQNFRALVAAGFHPACRITATKLNLEALTDISRLHKELGASGSAVIAVNPINSDCVNIADQLMPEVAPYAVALRKFISAGVWEPMSLMPLNGFVNGFAPNPRKDHACGAPLMGTPVVDAAGRVFICIYVVGDEKFQVADVNKGTWDLDRINALCEQYHVSNIDGCRTCAYRNFCAGGCYSVLFDEARKNQPASRQRRELTCATTKICVDYMLEVLFADPPAASGEKGMPEKSAEQALC